MRPKRSGRKPARQRTMAIRRDAAGIDIGARRIHVAVDPERDARPVREFQTFTQDLYALADWLKACAVRTVAMESTGVFWIPLFQILETRGFEVCLVNAHHVKHVPGRKTDIADCQWLQSLHAVGLLTASFRPAQAICGLRSLLRHRESLIQAAASHVQRMQKVDLIRFGGQINYVVSVVLRSSCPEKPDGCGRCGKLRSVQFSMASIPSEIARRSYAAGLICPSVECRRRWL